MRCGGLRDSHMHFTCVCPKTFIVHEIKLAISFVYIYLIRLDDLIYNLP